MSRAHRSNHHHDNASENADDGCGGLLSPPAFHSPTSLTAHDTFRSRVRSWLHAICLSLTDRVSAAEECGYVDAVWRKECCAAGFGAMRAPVQLGGTPPIEEVEAWKERGFVTRPISEASAAASTDTVTPTPIAARLPTDFAFDAILFEELLRATGSQGVTIELAGGSFGLLLPLLMSLAQMTGTDTDTDTNNESTSNDRKWMRTEILEPMARGEIRVCMAMTEAPPSARASTPDHVSGIPPSPSSAALSRPRRFSRTTAIRMSVGSLQVYGSKNFISFAMGADYILTGCQVIDQEEADQQPQPTQKGQQQQQQQGNPSATGKQIRQRRRGLSLILIPSALPGVRVTRLPMSGWRSSATARIDLDGVTVPSKFLLLDGSPTRSILTGRTGGTSNDDAINRSISFGLFIRSVLRKHIQRERWSTSILAVTGARCCVEETMRFVRNKTLPQQRPHNKRGRVDTARSPIRLIDSTSIQHTLIHLASRIQAAQTLIDQLTHEMSMQSMREYIAEHGAPTLPTAREDESTKTFSPSSTSSAPASVFRTANITGLGAGPSASTLAQQTALVKVLSSRLLSDTCIECARIMGSAALVQQNETGIQSGRGRAQSGGGIVERMLRDQHANAAAGGSEHTLLAFIARRAKL